MRPYPCFLLILMISGEEGGELVGYLLEDGDAREVDQAEVIRLRPVEAAARHDEDALLPKERKSNAGAKRYDVVMMFKLMVLQRYYNLSDEQAEY